MLAPFATALLAVTLVAVLAAIYLMVVEARCAIVAALRGRSLLVAGPTLASVELRISQRYPSPARPLLRATIQRAAA